MTWYKRLSLSRPPDFIIGDPGNPSVYRWWVIPRNHFFNIYLHHFLRSDDDRALHDHPWINMSYILEGDYIEVSILPGGVNTRIPYHEGQLKFRRAKTAHRVEINKPCWTLFVTGPTIRNWGFHCPKGWRRWQDFVKDGKKGQVGKGCED